MGSLWDSNMRTSDEIGMYITVVEMTGLTVVMCMVMHYAFKKNMYSFMKWLIFLCLIADIGTALLSIGLALETDPVFHAEHEYFVARLIGWDTLLFNLPTNLLHWLFAFKYWVISVEVPLALTGQIKKKANRERLYFIFNIFMILVNVAFCIWVSIERYRLSIQSAGQKAPVSLVNEVSDLYHVVTGLMLVSALFFADALRRIKKSLTTNPNLIQN